MADLSDNQLVSLHQSLATSATLESLNLHRNRLQNLPDMDGLSSLEKLDIRWVAVAGAGTLFCLWLADGCR